MKRINIRRRAGIAATLCAVVAGALVGAPAQAMAGSSLSQRWGGANVEATRTHHGPGFSLAWDVTMRVTLSDRLADSKCVYVEYKVITARGTDADSTLATACNRQTVSRSTTRAIGTRMGMATPTAVEFKMCHAVWGTDPCQKTTIRF